FELYGRRHALAYPRALALLGITPIFVIVAWRSLTDLGRLSLWLATSLRILGFSAVAIALALPSRLEEKLDLAIAVAIDVSDSIADEGLAAAAALLDPIRARAEAMAGDVDVAFTAFAGRARRIPSGADEKPVPSRGGDGQE